MLLHSIEDISAMKPSSALPRRHFLYALPAAGLLVWAPRSTAADAAPQQLRGRLETPSEDTAGLRLPDGSFVELHGDEQTRKVLHDERLRGWDFEVYGHRRADGGFDILPIHLAALFTYQNAKQLRVTYYCDVCAIRTYSPGICLCCREDTRVDAVNPESITKAAGS